jgi:hypothetical protein
MFLMAQSFFTMWWGEQTDSTKDLVRQLVKSGQLDFVNGGCGCVVFLMHMSCKNDIINLRCQAGHPCIHLVGTA